MLLAVDIGNTRAKAAVFENDSILSVISFDENSSAERFSEIASAHSIHSIIVSSVGGWVPDFKTAFPEAEVNEVSYKSNLPLEILYATPETLGVDRIVLAAGAVQAYPRMNRLIVDAGTCITYDFVSADGIFHGGAISPGLRLRYKSLNDYTAKLPLLETFEPAALIGNSTIGSIHSGIINGTCAEVDGMIAQYAKNHSNFITILTGGDCEILAKRLKNTIFANSNFLLESLNQIHQYQRS